MTATGIGAPVRRKEDQRFITGKGHYTDDHATARTGLRVFRPLAACACEAEEDRHRGGRDDAGRDRDLYRRGFRDRQARAA